eukprot:Skav232088  [mRNA]  locus=scaffold2353:39984:40559:+ [translate_table: standard]
MIGCNGIESQPTEPQRETLAKLQSAEGPQKIDINYILERTKDWGGLRLSSGFLGRLYQAADGDFKFTVLKVQKQRTLKEIKDEAAILDLAKISHPNIASLRGYVFSAILRDIAVFIYEFADGNLSTHLSDAFLASQLLWKSRVEIVRGVLRALHYLHTTVKEYHQFVQPAYIFLTPEGELVLTVFFLEPTP